jgi:hypothetical protein
MKYDIMYFNRLIKSKALKNKARDLGLKLIQNTLTSDGQLDEWDSISFGGLVFDVNIHNDSCIVNKDTFKMNIYPIENIKTNRLVRNCDKYNTEDVQTKTEIIHTIPFKWETVELSVCTVKNGETKTYTTLNQFISTEDFKEQYCSQVKGQDEVFLSLQLNDSFIKIDTK